jgi:hypothetical protein
VSELEDPDSPDRPEEEKEDEEKQSVPPGEEPASPPEAEVAEEEASGEPVPEEPETASELPLVAKPPESAAETPASPSAEPVEPVPPTEPEAEPRPAIAPPPPETQVPPEEAAVPAAPAAAITTGTDKPNDPMAPDPEPAPAPAPAPAPEKAERLAAARKGELYRWIVRVSYGLAPIALLVASFALWKACQQVEQGRSSQCKSVADDLTALDEYYEYDSCTLQRNADDDSELARKIKLLLDRADEYDCDAANPDKISFYKGIQLRLADPSVCRSPQKAGRNEVWLSLYCLEGNPENWEQEEAAAEGWVALAGQFKSLAEQPANEPARDRLSDCAAISKAQAYQWLAAITGEPDAKARMIAAVNAIGKSDVADIAQWTELNLAIYDDKAEGVPNDVLQRARGTLTSQGTDDTVWKKILPAAHGPLRLTAMGVVVEAKARTRSQSVTKEREYGDSVDRLAQALGEASDAAQFLRGQKNAIRADWYQSIVHGASAACEKDPQRTDASTLESLRAIYGWWTQTPMTPVEWNELQAQSVPWLKGWSPRNEITTTLCSLATGLIDREEATHRFEGLLAKQTPEGQGLCYLARSGSKLWTAGARTLDLLKDRCSEKVPAKTAPRRG